MARAGESKVCALALHKAHKFLTDKLRRLLESTGDFPRFTHLVLGAEYDFYCDAAMAELDAMPEAALLVFGDEDYPSLLAEISYAPFALYLRGRRSLLKENLVSIVGTREPSEAGRIAAARLASHFVTGGHAIVSGIARGVDGIAHHAALAAGGGTIAVLPNGFDHLYPLENRDLYHAAAEDGNILLVSEYPPAQKPQRHHFIRRNRVIAGLSALTVFVEGDIKSGGMITVNYALAEGRDVAALSDARLKNNAGGNRLIADGALDLTQTAFSAGIHPVSA